MQNECWTILAALIYYYYYCCCCISRRILSFATRSGTFVGIFHFRHLQNMLEVSFMMACLLFLLFFELFFCIVLVHAACCCCYFDSGPKPIEMTAQENPSFFFHATKLNRNNEFERVCVCVSSVMSEMSVAMQAHIYFVFKWVVDLHHAFRWVIALKISVFFCNISVSFGCFSSIFFLFFRLLFHFGVFFSSHRLCTNVNSFCLVWIYFHTWNNPAHTKKRMNWIEKRGAIYGESKCWIKQKGIINITLNRHDRNVVFTFDYFLSKNGRTNSKHININVFTMFIFLNL